MKCKWGSCFILLIVIVITVFGIFEKRTYTNIAEDKSYLDELYVAQLPENICLEETENLSVNLPQVPVIIRVSVLGDVEHIGGTSRQLVKVEDVYKGTEPAVGQDIYLTCSRWSLSLYSEPYSIERGFVNIMEVGGEYLVLSKIRQMVLERRFLYIRCMWKMHSHQYFHIKSMKIIFVKQVVNPHM